VVWIVVWIVVGIVVGMGWWPVSSPVVYLWADGGDAVFTAWPHEAQTLAIFGNLDGI
jgi:hypothetical protein